MAEETDIDKIKWTLKEDIIKKEIARIKFGGLRSELEKKWCARNKVELDKMKETCPETYKLLMNDFSLPTHVDEAESLKALIDDIKWLREKNLVTYSYLERVIHIMAEFGWENKGTPFS